MSNRILLTDEELAERIGEPVERINRWRRAGIIPVIKLGYRTLRYHQESVEASLLRRQIKAKGMR